MTKLPVELPELTEDVLLILAALIMHGPREGAPVDQPEGARYMRITDSLSNVIVQRLLQSAAYVRSHNQNL